MCFERRDLDEESRRARRPTREDIRQLFERYGRPTRVGEDAAAEAKSAPLNGHAERPETVSRSPNGMVSSTKRPRRWLTRSVIASCLLYTSPSPRD